MKRARVFVLLGMIVAWPSAAYAAAGFWAWLEELSGPGPFHGFVVSAPVLCERDGKLVKCWQPISKDTPETEAQRLRPERLLVLSVGRLGSGDNVRFKDEEPLDTREVNVLQTSWLYMFRLHPSLDAGVGAGVMRFSGHGFDPFLRFTLVPASLSFRPLALTSQKNRWFAHFIRLDLETSFVTEGFTAAQFGSSTSKFAVGPEFLTRAAFVFDLGSIVWNPKTYGR
jgi:hypothetical protein